MSARPEFPEMLARFGGQPEEPAPVPLPTEIGRYVIRGGTSENRWGATEFILGPNDKWYRVLLVETSGPEIQAGMFVGQELMPLVPYNETDK